jgi:pimeloyl-ACP methyl ester carboxylesterase
VSTVVSIRKHATVNGISMSWLEWPNPGISGNCSVVLLHGIIQSADESSHIARHLARHHHVVFPDLRGRGETEMSADACDPGTMAADVADLIAQLGLEQVVVIGRNHGGVVGYHLAAGWPDWVHGLILGDSTPEVSAERAARRLEVICAIPPSFDSLDTAIEFYQRGLGVSEARARHDIPNDLAEVDGGYVWRHNLESIATIERAAAPRADWDVLAKITAPTLVLRGQRGRIAPEVATRMQETIQRCEVQTIYGAGPDVFLGPGSEQAIGAIDMWLMRLNRV